MAVAKDQVKELLEITLRHIDGTELLPLLADWKKASAYTKNKSFRVTIDRITEEAKQSIKDASKAAKKRKRYDDDHRVGF